MIGENDNVEDFSGALRSIKVHKCGQLHWELQPKVNSECPVMIRYYHRLSRLIGKNPYHSTTEQVKMITELKFASKFYTENYARYYRVGKTKSPFFNVFLKLNLNYLTFLFFFYFVGLYTSSGEYKLE